MTVLASKFPKRDVQADILDAAEAVFANLGFDGTTTRAIAEEGKVNLATIHYHFSSKEKLFEIVVARRSEQVNSWRRELLATELNRSEGVRLEGIFDALMRPMIDFGGTDRNASSRYGRLVVHIASRSDERSVRLTTEYFNEIALEFIDVLERAVPGLGRENAVWAYTNAISVGMLMMARTGRVTTLSGGLCDENDDKSALDRTVRYLTAGTLALAKTPAP